MSLRERTEVQEVLRLRPGRLTAEATSRIPILAGRQIPSAHGWRRSVRRALPSDLRVGSWGASRSSGGRYRSANVGACSARTSTTRCTSSPELSEIHDPTVLADGPAASERSRSRSGSVADRARRYRCGRDAPLRRDRRRASPPPGSTSRTRQSPTPALPDRPDVCDSYNRGRLIRASGLTAERLASAARRSGLPTSCIRTAGVLDVGDAGRPGCCYRPKAEASSDATEGSHSSASEREQKPGGRRAAATR